MDSEILYKKVLDCCFEVHKALGPGLLESAYKKALVIELQDKNIKVDVEKEMPIVYKGREIQCGYRADLIVEDLIIIELKAVLNMNEIHTSQILTYMKLSNIRLGLLINFNVKLLKEGIYRRII